MNKSIKKLSLKGTFWIQLQKKIANIQRIEQDDISAIKFEVARLHFLSDVFVAVAFYICCLSSLMAVYKNGHIRKRQGCFLKQNSACFSDRSDRPPIAKFSAQFRHATIKL